MTTWIVLRAAGIGAYVVLFASVAFGLVATSGPFGKRFAKASSISIHQFLSTVGLVLLAIHIGGLLLDTFMHFGPKEVLFPGASSYRPLPVAVEFVNCRHRRRRERTGDARSLRPVHSPESVASPAHRGRADVHPRDAARYLRGR
jgi:hypothetical protein